MDSADFQKAKGYVLRLLKLRPRTRLECLQKMAFKQIAPDITLKVIDYLESSGMVDDAAFARLWLQSRLSRYGMRRLLRELEQKGISREQVVLSGFPGQEDYDEITVARQIARKRCGVYKGINPLKQKKRLSDYLIRRGFSQQTINQVLKDI